MSVYKFCRLKVGDLFTNSLYFLYTTTKEHTHTIGKSNSSTYYVEKYGCANQYWFYGIFLQQKEFFCDEHDVLFHYLAVKFNKIYGKGPKTKKLEVCVFVCSSVSVYVCVRGCALVCESLASVRHTSLPIQQHSEWQNTNRELRQEKDKWATVKLSWRLTEKGSCRRGRKLITSFNILLTPAL